MKNLKSLVSTPALTQWRTQVAPRTTTPGWAEFLLTLLVLLFLQW